MSHLTVLDVRSTALLLAGLGLTLLPHVGRLPPWFGALMISVGIWRYMSTSYGWRLPNLFIRVFIVGAVIVGVYSHFGTLVGRDAGVALLVTMMILKLLELRQRRDVMVLLLLSYFALSTHFLYNQTMGLALYVGLVTWLMITLHVYLTQDQIGHLKTNLKYAGKLIAQATPLALVLFLLFPRISGPLWGLPHDVYSAMTGISDEMTPGAISNLGQSDAIAFRASFEGEIPKPELRYWRGPVLWETDGRTWRNTDSKRNYAASTMIDARAERIDDPIEYTVTLEPHNKRWLFALDIAATSPNIGMLTSDYQIIAARRIRERTRYEMLSYTDYNTGRLAIHERQRALRLPKTKNTRAINLGRQLRNQYGNDDEAIVQHMLKTYRNEEYIYTLTPPLLQSSDPVDEFLFSSRKGFCEHYSSSFVTVMRAAGIPARVVTGYQGGEVNPMGDYLIVRQRDAHAWSEVWLPDRGWVRIDPTAAVAPERVEQSFEVAQQQQGEAIRFSDAHTSAITQWMKQVGFGIDTVNNSWNQWVLGFDKNAQRNMLENLGMKVASWKDIIPLLVFVVLSLLAIVTFLTFLPKRQQLDPIQMVYNQFCKKLSRKGFERAASETPNEFAQRVISKRPELKQPVETITSLYVAMRYGSQESENHLNRMKQMVGKFRP